MPIWIWIVLLVSLGVVLLSLWQVKRRPAPALQESTKALLLSPTGQLESLRVLHGTPPQTIVCGAGRYRRDGAVAGEHAVYRREA
jgi:hypothetical protein